MSEHPVEHPGSKFNSSFPAMPAEKLPLAPQIAVLPMPSVKSHTSLYARSPVNGDVSQRSQASLRDKTPVHGNTSQRSQASLRDKTPVHGNTSQRSRTPLGDRCDIATPMSENRVVEGSGGPEQRLSEEDERVRAIMAEYNFDKSSLPSLSFLRAERVRLMEEVRHHKDEQDSLSLDIEGLDNAAEFYNTAACLQRLENFVSEASEYIERSLPGVIERFVEDDRRRSDEEVAAYAQELESQRERILQKAAAAKERALKLGSRNDQHVDPEMDKSFQEVAAHVDGNVGEIALLTEKFKNFRSLKSKLLAELAREKRQSDAMEHNLNIQIKNAELANARDARVCKELNTSNTSLTANVQMLMSQLNVEHYGVENIPTAAQLVQEYRDRMLMLEKTPVNAQESVSGSEQPVYEPVQNGVAVAKSVSSRGEQEASASVKRLESQSSRQSESVGKVAQVPSEKFDPTPGERINRTPLEKPPIVSRQESASLSRASEKHVESVRSRSNAEQNTPKAALAY